MNSNTRVKFSWNLLRYSYGLVILLVGLDKIFATDLIVSWPKYISPFVADLLPLSTPLFLVIVGVIEVIVALMMLTKWPRIACFIAIAWLLIIALNLLLGGYVDVAVRDILLAIALFIGTELALVVQDQETHA